MQFPVVFATALAVVGSAFAAPTTDVSSRATSWTIQSFTRTCNSGDTSCNYSFGINTNDGSKATACAYKVNGSPASHATYANIKCGAFVIGSTWSGQFGAGKGFQVLSVVRNNQIIYPDYQDSQIVNGRPVSPNKSFTPQNKS